MNNKIITLNDILTKNVDELTNLYKEGYTLSLTICNKGCVPEESCVDNNTVSFYLPLL
jgi:hypothetical protein